MKRNMTKYAGLTDHPDRCRQEHGNPVDWKIEKEFGTVLQSRIWEQQMHHAGYEGGRSGPEWGWGYTYTITKSTKQ